MSAHRCFEVRDGRVCFLPLGHPEPHDCKPVGTCPQCRCEQPLIWDGTLARHRAPGATDEWPTGCAGAFLAPLPAGGS